MIIIGLPLSSRTMGQHVIGTYTTDDYSTVGVGLEVSGTVEVGSIIPAECYAGMQHLKVEGIRFALARKATVKSVKLYAVERNGQIAASPLASKALNQTCLADWTEVALASPVEVSTDWAGLLPVYEISVTAGSYIVSCYAGEVEHAGLIAKGPFGAGGAITWQNFGDDYGTTAIQLIGSCAPLKGTEVMATQYVSATVAAGKAFDAKFKIMSHSEEPVSLIGYKVLIDGQIAYSTDMARAMLPAGFHQLGYVECTLTAPQKAGRYNVEFVLTEVNGEAVSTESGSGSSELPYVDKASFVQTVVKRLVPRYSIVEEYTGTRCGYCPMGWLGMKYVKDHLADKAGVIAIHQYNIDDPMYINAYHKPPFTGAPQCRINRATTKYDPYPSVMKVVIPEIATSAPEVEVSVSAHYDDARERVMAEATTDFMIDLPGSEIVFVLTADGLKGTTNAWKQSNYLFDEDTFFFGKEFADFCQGGKYGQEYVGLTFDDVMIASSWPSETLPNAATPYYNTREGAREVSTYTLSLPSKPALRAAIDEDQVYVTAMVLKADGTIANAARCKVEAPDGIQAITRGAESTATDAAGISKAPAYLDMQGRRVSIPQRGIYVNKGRKALMK